MRTAWKLKGMTIHTYVPCGIPHTVTIITGVDPARLRVETGTGILIGVFRITGMHNLQEEKEHRYIDDTVLIGLVERQLGISFHEVTSGVNLSDGYFTLYSQLSNFDPIIIRKVMQSLDCTKLENRFEVLYKKRVPMEIENACPMCVDWDIFEATCPRCCESWSQREFEKLFIGGKNLATFDKGSILPMRKCPECGLLIAPHL